MRKPYAKRGPAAAYADPGETILELGNGTGNGGLLALRNLDDGRILAQLYNLTGVDTGDDEPRRAIRAELEAAKLRTHELETAARNALHNVELYRHNGANAAHLADAARELRTALKESGNGAS